MNFYQLGKSKDRELDLMRERCHLAGPAAELGDYSTARGAVYPAFATTVYFTGFPPSMILSAEPV